MPETAAVVGEFFAADGVAAAGTEALAAGEAYGAGTVAATSEGLAAAGAGVGEAATAGAALGEGATAAAVVGGAGAAGAGGSFLQTVGSSAANGLGSAVVTSLLAPSPQAKAGGVQAPKTLAPSPMPDPVAQQQAIKKSIVEQTTRRGRASTILTNTGGSGRLGG